MIAGPAVAGIDVSKDRLDVFIVSDGAELSVANEDRAIEALGRRLVRQGVRRVALEASGGYERKAVAGLGTAGCGRPG